MIPKIDIWVECKNRKWLIFFDMAPKSLLVIWQGSQMVEGSLWVHEVPGSNLGQVMIILRRSKRRPNKICQMSLLTAARVAQLDRALDGFMAQHWL